MKRCGWCVGKPDYEKYHDEEWGVPVFDDGVLFEFLILEGAQAGLSWYTILKRREAYRKAYHNFKPEKVARYGTRDIERLLTKENIIRNRLKVSASILNAKAFLKVQEEFGSFAKYQWSFVDGKQIKNKWKDLSQVPATTKISDQMSSDLKARGFKFVGSTIIYAHMQATGMVNDHLVSCFRYKSLHR